MVSIRVPDVLFVLVATCLLAGIFGNNGVGGFRWLSRFLCSCGELHRWTNEWFVHKHDIKSIQAAGSLAIA